MNIALLFDSDAPKYNGYYGPPIRDAVFGLGIIQKSNRHMKVSVGDVLTFGYARTPQQFAELMRRVYFSGTWSLLLGNRLEATYAQGTVYAITFENMPKQLAADLHSALLNDDAYLGLIQVDFAYGPHLTLMRNSMITLYRVEGSTCRIFYSMGEEDARDDQEPLEMGKLGYADVAWEDKGAHKTIFDDFDSLEHFKRVAAFREAVTGFVAGGEDEAYELVMVLEDLNPQLFNVLGAAVRALDQAETEEDVAQAAISGRRYMEKLADALFPPRDEPFKGRKVGKPEYKNRIWAYAEQNTGGDGKRLKVLGGEVDRLIGEFNAGLHSEQPKRRIQRALADVGVLTAGLLALDASTARQPYLAHQRKIVEFFQHASERYREND